MIKNPLFGVMFATLLVVGVLNKMALYFNLYWTTAWFDILMHFLGGLWVALFALWLLSLLVPRLLTASATYLLVVTVLVVLIVGLLWEAFELYYEISKVYAPNFLQDTITDIIMDVVGAILAFTYAYPKVKPTSHKINAQD